MQKEETHSFECEKVDSGLLATTMELNETESAAPGALRRSGEGRSETVHVVASVAIVAEQELVLKETSTTISLKLQRLLLKLVQEYF